jgi:acetoin utilization protein AcuB
MISTEGTMSSPGAVPIHQFPVVREFMTPSPVTVGRQSSLSVAGQTMRKHHVRHLPVLNGGRIEGVLSERDLLLLEAVPGVNPTIVRVEEAMVEDVFTVDPETPIGEAIETMIDRKLGSAIVCEDERVLGVFTTVDALRALHRLLERR